MGKKRTKMNDFGHWCKCHASEPMLYNCVALWVVSLNGKVHFLAVCHIYHITLVKNNNKKKLLVICLFIIFNLTCLITVNKNKHTCMNILYINMILFCED